MNLKKYTDVLVTFIMCDCVEFYKYVYKFLCAFYYFSVYYQIPVIVTDARAICQETLESKDISFEIANGKTYKFNSKNYNVQIEYIVDGKKYAMVYNNSNPLAFPPYSIDVYKKRVRPGILEFIVDGNAEYSEILKMYAGPKLDFYNSIDGFQGVDISWIIGEKPKDISYNNSYGERVTLDPNSMKMKTA